MARPCAECRDAFTGSTSGLCRRCFIQHMAAYEARCVRRALRSDTYSAVRHTLALAVILSLPLHGGDRPTADDIRWARLRIAKSLLGEAR